MSLLQRTRELLKRYRFYPKKRLGQHFVTDRALLERMTSYASLSPEDVVLEVGAGLGFLTRLLAERCGQVIAVEIDGGLMGILRDELRDMGNVKLVHGDVLDTSLPRFNKVVSTPPYSISSPLLFWLLERPFNCAVLTFQEEFANRLAARVGSRDYSRLTVATYYKADAELLDFVPKSSFHPPPDVHSVVVRLKPRAPPFKVKDEKTFFELVKVMFTQRNKKVRNAFLPFLLKRRIGKERALKFADSLLFHEKRVRELAPEDFGAIANEVVEKENLLR